jgi:hypothetical protein
MKQTTPHPRKMRLKVPIKYTHVLFYILFFYTVLFIYSVGRDSSDGIATRYGLDGPRIESQCGRDFPHLSRPTLGPNKPSLHNWYRVSSGGKAAGEWRWPPTPSSAEVKEKSRAIPLLPLWDFVDCSCVKFIYSISSIALLSVLVGEHYIFIN